MKPFTLDIKEIYHLEKFYRKSPVLFAKVIVNMMNTFAFGTRKVALNIIHKKMVVRSTRFVDSRVRIRKASLSLPNATVGSIYSQRFTGWEEQEGTPTQRTRVFGIMARKGDIRNKTIAPSRMSPSSVRIDPDDYAGKSERFKNTAMIMDLKRRGVSKPFVITRHSKFKQGLYRWRKGVIETLQVFKTKRQPRPVKWMSGAKDLYMTTNRVRNEWAKSVKHVLKLR